MATNQDAPPRAQRIAALGALELLGAATALAFGRVFAGPGTSGKLLLAATASVALGWAMERRSLLLATLVSAAGLLIAIGVLVFPDTTWLALPTRQTLVAVGEALGHVGHQAQVQVAPTPAVAPLLLAAVTATWTASFSAQALSMRAGSPLLAVLPPIALVGFADTVLEDGARPGYALLVLVSVLLVVFVDGLRRIRQWGPVWTTPGRRRLGSIAGRGARRVGATAVGVAMLLPGILPGFRAAALIDFSSPRRTDANLDPFVSIKANLTRNDPVQLFRVTSTDQQGRDIASYWRAFALDRFDGQTWSSSDPGAAHGSVLRTPATLPPPDAPSPGTTLAVEQRFQVLASLKDTPLPMAYPARSVEVPSGAIRYDAELGAVAAPGGIETGTDYTVTSDLVIPTAAQLDAATFPPGSFDPRYTQVPASVPPIVHSLAERWTAGATDPYRKVLALMDHFTEPGLFHYDANVDTREDGDALVRFLTVTRTGFCQQFATAMAVMVRELGYPARVAVGFRPGDLKHGVFTVTTDDAHSWVEVLFPGYGWLAFEPTPNRPNPISQRTGSYLNPATSVTDPQAGSHAGAPSEGGPASPTGCQRAEAKVPARICNQLRLRSPVRSGAAAGRAGPASELARSRDGYGIPLRIVVWVAGLLLLLLLVLVPVAKALIRLAIGHRPRPPREAVLAAYRLFDAEATDVGLGRRRGETVGEHRRRLAGRVRSSDGHLDRLAAATIRAAYSEAEVTEVDARAARRDARVAIADVRRQVGPVRRVLGVYRPGL